MNEALYVVVIIGSGPYYGMVPDFSLMASGATREAVISDLQKLANEAVAVAKRYQTPIPNATSRDVIESHWKGDDYAFSSVMVRI